MGQFVESSSYGTIESLNHFLVQHICQSSSIPSTPGDSAPIVEVTIRKPSAIPFATPSITIARSSTDYPNSTPSSLVGSNVPSSSSHKRVFIAVGSNIGDSVDHIRRAIQLLEQGGCRLVDCSRLYESAPMYVEDQERFTNGAIEVSSLDITHCASKMLQSLTRSRG